MLVMCRATERASRVPTVVEASKGVNTMWFLGEMICMWWGGLTVMDRGLTQSQPQLLQQVIPGDDCHDQLHSTATVKIASA